MVAFPRAALTLEMRQILARLLSAVSDVSCDINTGWLESLRAARGFIGVLAWTEVALLERLSNPRSSGFELESPSANAV